MNITRRGFLKAVAALSATPVIAKIPDIKAIPKAEKISPVMRDIQFAPSIGGLYKDGQLVIAFKDWQVEQTRDFAETDNMPHVRAGLQRWNGSASCLLEKHHEMIECGGKYDAVFIIAEKAQYTGKVFLSQVTTSFSSNDLITTDISFDGIGEVVVL